MKLSEITENLGSKYSLVIDCKRDNTITKIEKINKLPVLLSMETLYITTIDIFNTLDIQLPFTYNFIVILNNEKCVQHTETCNVISLSDQVDIENIYDDVKSILEDDVLFKDQIFELYDFLNTDISIEQIIEKSFKILNNPIIYYNYHHEVILFKQEMPVENKVWNETLKLGYYDSELMDEEFYKDIEKVTEKRKIVFRNIGENNTATAAVIFNNYVFGFINVLEYYKEFSKNDMKVLEVIAEIIAIKSLDKSPVLIEKNYTYGNVFKDLIENKIHSHKELHMKLKNRDLLLNCYYRVILVEIQSNISSYCDYVKHRITNMFTNHQIINYQNHIIILEVYQTQVEFSLHDKLIDFLLTFNYKMGVSDVFDDLLELHNFYLQAQKALLYGDLLAANTLVNNYSDYRLFDFIKQSFNNSESYYHPIISEIEAYDKLNNTQLSITLYNYLDNSKSVKKTSESMYVHKNTILYRINQITELFKLNLDNKDETFHILLSYKVKIYSNKLNEDPQHV